MPCRAKARRLGVGLALLLVPVPSAGQSSRAPEASQRGQGASGGEAATLVGRWFWMDGGVGYESTDLRVFNTDARDTLTAGITPAGGDGIAAHVGLGVRLLGFLRLGGRATVASLEGRSPRGDADHWTLWIFDPEVGFRIPLGRVEPHLDFALGYAAVADLDHAVDGLKRGLDVDGLSLRGTFGVDALVTRHLTLGLAANGRMLFLSRPGVPTRDLIEPRRVNTINEAQARLLEGDGSSIGAGWGGYLVAGLHY